MNIEEVEKTNNSIEESIITEDEMVLEERKQYVKKKLSYIAIL